MSCLSVWCQAISWNNESTGLKGINISGISIELQKYSYQKNALENTISKITIFLFVLMCQVTQRKTIKTQAAPIVYVENGLKTQTFATIRHFVWWNHRKLIKTNLIRFLSLWILEMLIHFFHISLAIHWQLSYHDKNYWRHLLWIPYPWQPHTRYQVTTHTCTDTENHTAELVYSNTNWVSRHLNSPACWLFVQQFVQADIKGNNKLHITGSFWGEFTGDWHKWPVMWKHYSDIIRSMMASQITSVSDVCSTGCSGADQRKHQSSVSMAFVRRINQWPVCSPHKGLVMWKMFPFDDSIICCVAFRFQEKSYFVFSVVSQQWDAIGC